MRLIALFVNLLFNLALVALVGGAAALLLVYWHVEPELPSIEILKDVRLQVPLRVFSRDGKLLAEFGEKRRIPLGYSEIPPRVQQAFLAAEDDRFYQHPGVDYQALTRAAVEFIRTGERRQGGSTITMQVARNFFLGREKTIVRKIKEIFLALRIEHELSKNEILSLYLNQIYLGNRAYGIGAAAKIYYGVSPQDLRLEQIAMLAALPKAPSSVNPIANLQRSLQRRNYILGRMAELGYLSPAEAEAAQNAPDNAKIHSAEIQLEAPYLAEMVRAEMVSRFNDDAYTRGLEVYTTLDSQLQPLADRAVRANLQEYDKRHGYRGVIGHHDLQKNRSPDTWNQWLAAVPSVQSLTPALVTGVEGKSANYYLADGSSGSLGWQGLEWARPYQNENQKGPAPRNAAALLKPGDLVYLYQDQEPIKDKKSGKILDVRTFWRLAEIPGPEGSLVSLDPADGAILALTGGYDFAHSKFNRATQARRQPGSGFKAFIYSAALEAGFTPASLVNDAPLVIETGGSGGPWRPENFDGTWMGPIRLRVALYHSRNLVSVRLLRSMGLDHALAHLTRFGFDSNKLPHYLPLALGSGEVTPLEMARGFAVFANGGYLIDPYFIDRILDSHTGSWTQSVPVKVCGECPGTGTDGQPSPGVAPRVISPHNQFLMNSMLKDVIRLGTGRLALSLGRSDIAGKTGTTNDQRDTWFNGYNRRLVAVTWVGFDSFAPLGSGEVGGKTALPAWIEFMRAALKDVPDQDWGTPEGILSVKIDPATGRRAQGEQSGAITEFFSQDLLPEQGISTEILERSPDSRRPASQESLSQELF